MLFFGFSIRFSLASAILLALTVVSFVTTFPTDTTRATLIDTPTTSSTPHNRPFIHRRAQEGRRVSVAGLSLTHTKEVALLLPLQISAVQLELFYTAAAHAAATFLMQSTPPPLVHFAIQWAGLELHFVSDKASGDRGEGIPWEFMHEFCDMMAGVTRHGWTVGTYEQGFWNTAGTLGIFVALKFVERMVPV